MSDLISNSKTTLVGDDVIVRSIQFFTGEKWRTQSQSGRVATFVGRPPIPWGMLILTLMGFVFFIVPGVIMYFLVVRKMMRFQNIVVTANPFSGGSEVVITHPNHAKKLVERFIAALPPLEATIAAQG